MPRNRLLDITLLVLTLGALFLIAIGCEDWNDDPLEPDKNRNPETALTVGPETDTETFYRVHLFWKGFDDDGLISGFEYAIGDTTRQELPWHFTTRSDSEFVFPTATDADQSQTADHVFYVRAIDNEGREDRTPAFIDFIARTSVEPQSIIFREVANRMTARDGYLYVAAGENGMDVYDISDPGNIQRSISVRTGGNGKDVVLGDGHAYVANGPSGVAVLDISDPESPSVVANYATNGRASVAVDLFENYLFVADGKNGIVVLDVTVPEEPAFFARYRPSDRPSFMDVVVDNGFVFAAADTAGVLSLTFEPEREDLILQRVAGRSQLNPVFGPPPDNVAPVARGVLVHDGYLLIADGPGGLQVATIGSDGSLDTLEGSRLRTDGESIDLVAVDDRVFVADGFLGLVAIDLSIPTAPSFGSRIDFSGDVTGVTLVGDSLYVGNDDRGIMLVNVTDIGNIVVDERPELRFCTELVSGETIRSPSEEETLLVNSSVRFCWEGISAGGRVTGYRYQLTGVNISAIEVGPEVTSVNYFDLEPQDLYKFTVDTKDETGLWSTGETSAQRRFTVNYDPEARIDSVWYDPNLPDVECCIDITDQPGIRLEEGSTLYFRWSVTDNDIVAGDSIVGSFWSVKGANIFSPDSIESQLIFVGRADSLPKSPVNPDIPHRLVVGGIDSFGRREANGDEFPFHVNYAPSLTIVSPEPGERVRPVDDTVTFELTVSDREQRLDQVEVRYKFSTVVSAQTPSTIFASGTALPEEDGTLILELPTFGAGGVRVRFEATPTDGEGLGNRGPKMNVEFLLST